MNLDDRRTLDRHTFVFVHDLDLRPVCAYLQSLQILTEYNVQEIESKPTPFERKTDFMRIIKTRGAFAYRALYEALLHCGLGQYHLAKLLYPDLPLPTDGLFGKVLGPSIPLPEITAPSAQEIKANEQFYALQLLDREYGEVKEPNGVMVIEVDGVERVPESFNADDVYRNFSNPRGLALVINNKKFQYLPERLGTDVDASNIVKLMQRLGYQVKLKSDLKAKDMLDSITRFAKKPDHEKCDSAVVVILTHGEHGELYGVDGDPGGSGRGRVVVNMLVSQLDVHHCPHLREKPKLFFIQACRGKTYDLGDGQGDHADVGRIQQEGMCLSRNMVKADMVDAEEMKTRLPTDADFLIAYATTPGYVSWRNSAKGSWFIQAICEIFAKYAKEEHVMDMLTRVNRRVADAISSTGHKQMPEPCCRLRKKFFFFPGVALEQK